MRDNTGFFETHEHPERGWMLNNYPIKMLSGTEVEIIDKEYNIIPGIEKVSTDRSYNTAKSMSDMENFVVRDILHKTEYYKRLPTKGRLSGCDRFSEKDLDKDVRRILNLYTKLKGKGIEKFVIPSNIINIYSRLEI